MRSVCARAASSSSLPLSTSFAAWRSLTSRAFSRPASTNPESTSLSSTGMSADAITLAISPPITPAPTTAALKTNMRLTLASAAELAFRSQLVGEAAQRAAQRVRQLAAQQRPAQRGKARLGLDLERQRDARLVVPGLEDHAPHAAHARVLEVEHLAQARLEARDGLHHAAVAAGRGLPQPPAADPRPVALELDEVREAVLPGRPARLVVPQPLRLDGPALHDDARLRAHPAPSSPSARIARSARAMRCSRGLSSVARRARSARPADVAR